MLKSSVTSLIFTTTAIVASPFIDQSVASAQVSISPITIEVEAKRGQAQEFIDVTNPGDRPFRARVYAEAFTYDADTGFKILKSSPTDLRPYLQFSPRELVVPPRTTRKIRLITRLAPNLPDGEYRAMIFTEPLQENITRNTQGARTRVITRVGSALLVRKGNVSPRLSVENAQWDKNTKKLRLSVRNTGKASAFARMNWSLTQNGKNIKSGRTATSALIAEGLRNVVVNTSKEDELNLTPGNYQLTGEFTWGRNNENRQPFSINFTIPAQTGVRK
ncbi:P pilus assembly protein, chaperone PapD [Calothrix sp. NIES-3974]|uniref:P pilus assembly protein, chaperone PapD n=1 Tax=Calothrix sp. NIES-3974 TaxID=2005462 RepID=UPI000B6223F2|nr:P pilus assembly protein, chaperone PapD [Calothrix sp. NIES-3974]BAZ03967.1 hypothetical protein NIES3974_05970 [Calothrix sp. NIES-3974]